MPVDSLIVKKVVVEQISRIRTISDLARILEVSPEALRKDFAKEEGTSLSNFVSKVRIERAMELLSTSDLECKVICFASGFGRADVAARTFKSHTGLTMEEYRRSARDRVKRESPGLVDYDT